MTAFNKHIWKQLINITFTALLVTSCQSSDRGTPAIGDGETPTVGDRSISQQAITENQQPSTSQAVKPQPATQQNTSVAKTVKPKSVKTPAAKTVKSKSAKISKQPANKNSSAAKTVKSKSAKISKQPANKNSSANKTVKPSLVVTNSQQENEENKIKAIFYQNLQGLNAENLELTMGVIDKNNPSYEQVKQLTQTLFQSYDLQYAINQLEVMEIAGDKAKVKVTQTTKKIKGLAFRDNLLVSISTVKKYNGQWKIADTKTESINYLN